MNRQTQPSRATLSILAILVMSLTMSAQDWTQDRRVNLVFGLTQPLFAKGFNIEGNYIHERFIVNYSHGVSLDLSGPTATQALRDQGVAVHMPYTTGFGIGYRIAEWMNVRVEPKWHRFELYYDGAEQTSANEIVSYNTFSFGVGVYGHYQPFKSASSFLKGIMIAPSIRFWPTLSSTLQGDRFTYTNRNTGKNEELKTLDSGNGFSPFIINVSVGYSFDLLPAAP